jgi:hypothetical protein
MENCNLPEQNHINNQETYMPKIKTSHPGSYRDKIFTVQENQATPARHQKFQELVEASYIKSNWTNYTVKDHQLYQQTDGINPTEPCSAHKTFK